MKQIFLLIIAHLSLFPEFISAQTCEVSADKRAVIEALLCGQYAQEEEYQFSGPDCITKSVNQRLEDSVAQLVVLRACGYADFAKELKETTFIASKFMSTLSICTDQTIDFDAIFENAIASVKRKSGGLTCTPSLRNLITQRLPAFRSMINMSKDPNINSDIYKTLNIRVDANGNISEE